MKHPGFYLVLSGLSILFACSNDPADQASGTTNTASTTASTAPAAVESVAREKRPDAKVQGLKATVKEMSEKISFPGNTKRVSSRNVFKYDKNGNRIELASYKADGTLYSTIKSTYDANGVITGEQTFLPDGKVDVISVIKTDAKGNIIEQDDTRPAAAGDLFNFKYSFRYNEKGYQIERIAYKNGALSYRYEFKYDDNGNRSEWKQYGPRNALVGHVIYKYDAKNNVTEEFHHDGAGTLKAIYTFVRQFDKNNNWIRQEKLQDNKVIEIRERDIKYY